MERQRRQDVGTRASAALPKVWKELARQGMSHADLARACGVSSASMANLLYGEHSPSRKTAARLQTLLGVPLASWDRPCPPSWRPHTYEQLRPGARRKRTSTAPKSA